MQRRRVSKAIWLEGAIVTVGLSSAVAAGCGSRTGLDAPLTTETPDASVPSHDAHAESGLDAARDADARRDAPRDAVPDVFDAGVDAPFHHVPPDCAEAGVTYIYTIAENNQIFSFYPATNEFTLIGTLDCPSPGGAPFSMAVDHTGTAYVVFSNLGEDNVPLPGNGLLYKVSTKTAACERTPFVANQHGFDLFGMGFVATINAEGVEGETLFVAGDTANALGAIDLDTFELREVAPFQAAAGIPVNMAELTGTGSGRLYGFFAPTGANDTTPSYIIGIDPKTAAVRSDVELPSVEEGSAWAFGFWGGDFYTFTAPTDTTVVTRYRPSDSSIVEVAHAPPGVLIVGAGVSTCAPQD